MRAFIAILIISIHFDSKVLCFALGLFLWWLTDKLDKAREKKE